MNEQCQHLNRQEIAKIPCYIECDIENGMKGSTDCYVIERCCQCGEQFIEVKHYNYQKKIIDFNIGDLLKGEDNV
jgi:hypothetical protein